MTIDRRDLLELLRDTENSFVERKTSGDSKDDWIKTIAAFANTLDPSQEGVLFIGATNEGEIESNDTNYDSLQKKFSERKKLIYPPVNCTSICVRQDDRECLAVIVPGSPAKPHFAGPLYIRDFSKTTTASAAQYESLLAARTGKVYELQKWIGQEVTIVEYQRTPAVYFEVNWRSRLGRVEVCNQFYLTLIIDGHKDSYPLSAFEISYDHQHERLKIERTLIASGVF
ncbi:MAG: ATP-binding protein [Acidobacteriaceae bacterium]